MNHNNKIDCLYLNKLSNTIVDRLMCIAFVFSKTIKQESTIKSIEDFYKEYNIALSYIVSNSADYQ